MRATHPAQNTTALAVFDGMPMGVVKGASSEQRNSFAAGIAGKSRGRFEVLLLFGAV